MSLHALTRSVLFATSLLAGLGQSMDTLAHGVAHAHEAEHREELLRIHAHADELQHERREHHEPHQQHQHDQQNQHDQQHQRDQLQEPTQNNEGPGHALGNVHFEVTQPDHRHDHMHAVVDAGLKPRIDLVPFLVDQPRALALSVSVAVDHETPHPASPTPPPKRRHTSASPRAPPSR